jgi:hypothetical protein
MAKVLEYLNIGNRADMTVEELLRIVEKMYIDLATNLNKKPDIYQRMTDGLTTDTFLSNGDININVGTLKVEMLTSHPTSTSVTWTTLS